MAFAPIVMAAADAAEYAAEAAPARAEKGGPALHATPMMRRLATPWMVSYARAGLLEDVALPPGVVLDPACGSAAQLAALCIRLGRPGIGVELSGEVAPLAAVNLDACAAWAGDAPWLGASRILCGDGTAGDAVRDAYHASLAEAGMPATPPIALLHVDPARPNDAQRHILDEMEPALDVLLDGWAAHLSLGTGPAGGAPAPALLLDLSPRLSDAQRAEVDAIVEARWPGAATTWQWMTQGRGRIDRLSLWVGPLALPEPARLIRLDRTGDMTGLTGVSTTTEAAPDADAKTVGAHLTVVDPALLASGLASTWAASAFDGPLTWVEVEGRRPACLSDSAPSDDVFVQASGRIEAVLAAPDYTGDLLEIAENWAQAAEDVGRIALRCPVPPEVQPRLQKLLDRSLRHAEGDDCFIASTGDDHFLCRPC